jgi:alpha-ribazole phosphatase
MRVASEAIHAWRHPRAVGAAGRCIGRTDLAVDARKAKRVARRIQAFARRHGLPRVVFTSDLQRSRRVGEWLARWGWRHHVRPDLRESDFGDWDGRPWNDIARGEIDAWARDLTHARPGGGESVAMLLDRVTLALRALPLQALVVSHGGLMCAAHWLQAHGWPADGAGAAHGPAASDWPRAPRHGERWALGQALTGESLLPGNE